MTIISWTKKKKEQKERKEGKYHKRKKWNKMYLTKWVLIFSKYHNLGVLIKVDDDETEDVVEEKKESWWTSSKKIQRSCKFPCKFWKAKTSQYKISPVRFMDA